MHLEAFLDLSFLVGILADEVYYADIIKLVEPEQLL